MKLSKFILDIKDTHLTNEMIRTLRDYEVLRAYLSQIFPDEESIEILSMIQPTAENKNVKSYTEDFLPLHTQDADWMAKYINHSMKMDLKRGVNLPKVKYNNIESFVKFDPEFKDERDRYEENLTFVEIENMLIERKPNDESSYAIMQDRVNKSFHAEEDFRNEILRKLTNFGLDQHNVEVALETYADIWRPQAMDKTYINRYIRQLVLVKDDMPKNKYVEILDKITKQRVEWKALQEKRYYNQHKRIIDELGLATDNMKISDKTAYERETAWQDQYHENILPVLNIAYMQTEEQIQSQFKFKAPIDRTPTSIEPIIEK